MSSKTAIYYYSATGNSLSVAKQLNVKIPGSCLFPIVKYLKQGKQEVHFHSIGLVFPIHRMGIPQVVRDFIETISFQKSNYTFVVITGGKPKLSSGIFQVNSLLAKQNQMLHAGFHLKMPASYFSKFPLFTRHQQQLKFEKTKLKIDFISSVVLNRGLELEKGIGILDIINRLKDRKTCSYSKYLSVDDGCIRCGYCVMVCALQNIQLIGKKHVFLDNCNGCLACVHFCSKSVLQYKNVSRNKSRYHNPNISISDLIDQKR